MVGFSFDMFFAFYDYLYCLRALLFSFCRCYIFLDFFDFFTVASWNGLDLGCICTGFLSFTWGSAFPFGFTPLWLFQFPLPQISFFLPPPTCFEVTAHAPDFTYSLQFHNIYPSFDITTY